LAVHIQQPQFPELLRRFLYEQLNPESEMAPTDVPLDDCPIFDSRISVHHSAIARFYAPSDLCGAGGMSRERIRSCPSWHSAYARRDTVFIETDSEIPGMLGMTVGRVLLFFSFTYHNTYFPCALVHWFSLHGNMRDADTNLWVVKPEFHGDGRKALAIVHLDCVARGAHLLPVYGSSFLPEDFHFSYSLDTFRSYFINRYVDHHTYEFIS
jgi:hypothetical protein